MTKERAQQERLITAVPKQPFFKRAWFNKGAGVSVDHVSEFDLYRTNLGLLFVLFGHVQLSYTNPQVMHNEAIHDLNGQLLPLGALKILWRLKIRGLKTARLALMGLRQEYRTRRYVGLTYLLGDEIHRRAQEQHVQWGELGWTLEDNHIAHSYLRKVGCKHYKTYRIYEKALSR